MSSTHVPSHVGMRLSERREIGRGKLDGELGRRGPSLNVRPSIRPVRPAWCISEIAIQAPHPEGCVHFSSLPRVVAVEVVHGSRCYGVSHGLCPEDAVRVWEGSLR